MRGVTLPRRLFICTRLVKPSRQALGEVTCEQALYFGNQRTSRVSGTRNNTREFAARFVRPSKWRACLQTVGEGKGEILVRLNFSLSSPISLPTMQPTPGNCPPTPPLSQHFALSKNKVLMVV